MKNTSSITKTLLVLAMVFALTASGAYAQTRTVAAKASAKSAESAKAVNINQATVEQLTAINGIGPVMAKRIVEFREKNGAFKKVEDLLSVPGIGEKKLEKMRSQINL